METIITTLYAIPVYQCLVLSILLIFSNRKNPGNSRLILGIFKVMLTIYFAFNLFYRLKLFSLNSQLYVLILPLILGLIPVFYLYIISITRLDFSFTKIKLLHFLPSLFIFLLNSPYFLLSETEKLQFITYGFSLDQSNGQLKYLLLVYLLSNYLLINIQLIWYSILVWKEYKAHKLFIESNYSYTEFIDLDWIRTFIISFVFFFMFNNLMYIIGFRHQFFPQFIFLLALCMITLFSGIHGLMQKRPEPSGSDLFSNENTREKPYLQPEIDEININAGNLIQIKYSGSALTDDHAIKLKAELKELMKNKRVFTNENLCIDDVAVLLHTNSKYISQVINEYYEQNFYNYINSHRIEEAKSIIRMPGSEKYSLQGIANMVGFSSKSTFNKAFKKFTGNTPSEYRNQTLNS